MQILKWAALDEQMMDLSQTVEAGKVRRCNIDQVDLRAVKMGTKTQMKK